MERDIKLPISFENHNIIQVGKAYVVIKQMEEGIPRLFAPNSDWIFIRTIFYNLYARQNIKRKQINTA